MGHSNGDLIRIDEHLQSVRVLLADGHVVLRQGLAALLRQEGFEVVGEASDGHTAIKLCSALRPGIAIIEIDLPLLNGIDAAREIRKVSSHTHLILLTTNAEEYSVLASLRAGISGYVLKSNTFTILVQAIEAVSAGQTYLSPGVSRTIVKAYLESAMPTLDPLSSRERQVLQLIAEGMNPKEIGGVLGISAKTVQTHRSRIMQKLAIFSTAGLVRYSIKRMHGSAEISFVA
jgi:two-component system, NarL family, response regulator NreC